MGSVEEYIDFMLDKLYELSIEDISYSDYVQMTDWLGEIRKQVKRLEKKEEPMKPVPLKYEPLILHGWEYGCPACEKAVGFNKYAVEYTDEDPFCPSCGQKLDWTED